MYWTPLGEPSPTEGSTPTGNGGVFSFDVNATDFASGGMGTLTYSTQQADLPPGLTLSPAGVLSGTPTTSGTYTFLVTATDSSGAIGTTSYTVVINAQLLVTTPSLINWTAGFAGYSQQLSVTGGTGNIVSSAISDTLPPGLSSLISHQR